MSIFESNNLDGKWKQLVEGFFQTETGEKLKTFILGREQDGAVIFPPTPFRALELTSFQAVKVVIVGQDPYHERGQAQGLAFSVNDGIRIPPSLRNIYKELSAEFGLPAPESGNLTVWAKQGVLLINAIFTVEEGQAGSHAKRGWETLSDEIIAELARDPAPKAFLLWGGHAQKKAELIRSGGRDHLILCCNHPSPLSARRPPEPFLGCGHFKKVNDWLVSKGELQIRWLERSPDEPQQLELLQQS